MNLIFVGDIFASSGRAIVAENLKSIISEEKIDLVIANGENSAGGFGITPQIAEELFSYGVDVITSGNHIWDKREIYDYFPRQPRLLRPANYPEGPGAGIVTVSARNGTPCAVMNLQGRSSMVPLDCPFQKADQLIAGIPPDVVVRFVDFHAEMTSEKVAMGWHLNGRVSAMVGTHTHIPTADTRILSGGTAYQTDCGMTGPYDSVIGIDKDLVLYKFKTSMPVKMEAARSGVELHAVVVEVDERTGKATRATRLTRYR
jgi:2',3'-cyclic-nucleotide 2'-phosphodiesterase